MFKKAALTVGLLGALVVPSIVSARDRDDYRYGQGYNRELRERQRHREHEWREHEWREHERARRYYNNRYYNGSYNNGYYSNGYYDSYGYWHPYR